MSIEEQLKLLRELIFAQSYAKKIGDTTSEINNETNYLAPDGNKTQLPKEVQNIFSQLSYTEKNINNNAKNKSIDIALTLLSYGAGAIRWEYSNHYNTHRAFPSPRCSFPIKFYLVLGKVKDACLIWEYAPIDNSLIYISKNNSLISTHILTSEEINNTNFSIILISDSEKLPNSYGPLKQTLILLEVGHILRTLKIIGDSLGVLSSINLDIPEYEIMDTLNINISKHPERWKVQAAFFVTTSTSEPNNKSKSADLIKEELNFKSKCLKNDIENNSPKRQKTLLKDVLYDRNSGQSVKGLSGKITYIEKTIFESSIEHAISFLDLKRYKNEEYWSKYLRIFVSLSRIKGLSNGIYEISLEKNYELISKGKMGIEFQRAFLYPPESINIETMNLIWIFALDYNAILSSFGPNGFSKANIQIGWMAQGICCELASWGIFCRPCRSFIEDSVEKILCLPPNWTAAYELLCGVNRFSDLAIDLRT